MKRPGTALYFDGNSITVPIIVLGIYVFVGVVLVTIFCWGRLRWWRADKGPESTRWPKGVGPDEETGVAAIPPG